MMLLRSIILLTLLLAAGASSASTIDSLLKAGKIRATFSGNGGHTNSSLRLKVKNLSGKLLKLMVEPGRTFISVDTTEQDLIVVKALLAELEAGAESEFVVDAFCMESSKRSPATGSAFYAGPMASASLVRLAQTVNSGEFPESAIQSAVWVLSDGHQLSSVTGEPAAAALELRSLLAQLTGVPLPWYELTYLNDTNLVFSNRAEQLSGVLNFSIRNNAMVKVVVRDSRGTVVSVPERGRPLNPGDHNVNLQLNVAGWAKGDYDVFIYADDNLNQRFKFRL